MTYRLVLEIALVFTASTEVLSYIPLGRRVGCTSRCCVAGSPWFDAEFVVDRYPQTLPAANVAFSGLNGDMPEEKLESVQAGLPNHDRDARMISGDHVARDVECSCWQQSSSQRAKRSFSSHAVSPRLTRPTDTSEEKTALDVGCG